MHVENLEVRCSTVNSPNSGHFGTTAFVLYLESVLYWGVLLNSCLMVVCITFVLQYKNINDSHGVKILFDTKMLIIIKAFDLLYN